MRRFGLLQACLLLLALPAAGQDLVDRFKQARIRRVAAEMASTHGMRLEPRGVAQMPVRSDTLAAWMASLAPEPEPDPEPLPPLFVVDSVRVARGLARILFLKNYAETRWAFMQGQRRMAIDTTVTADIRSRMQALFGSPSLTLAEMDSVAGRPAEEVIQFEYWMVVNDSIPVMVLDVNGPLDRGVVVAVDARWRDELDAIRYGLLQPLFDQPRRAPFVDYFYQADTDIWYATGFDGATFFHRRIERPVLQLGRPRLSEYATMDAER